MARRRGTKGGEIALVVIGGIVAAIAAIPKEAWIVIGALALLALIVWGISKSTNKSASSPETGAHFSEGAMRVEIQTRSQFEYQKPKEPKGRAIPAKWISPDAIIDVAGTQINGGMVYFGSNLTASNGGIDPALIDPRYEVSSAAVDLSIRQTEYWPSYSTISPLARRGYINWLATGRSDSRADVGYVFLFFYGLERRVLVDAQADPVAQSELTLIESEVRRLLRIYGGNNSFDRYGSEFLDLLILKRTQATLHEGPPPPFTGRRVSALINVALGRMASLGLPVPAEWALAWIRSDPRISLPIALRRCHAQFEKLFLVQYRGQFGVGIKLPVNRTKLRIGYRPASSGFSHQEFTIVGGDLPDINAVVAPLKKLEAIVDDCAIRLAPYSRFVAKNSDDSPSLEGLLLLPQSLWPTQASTAMQVLNERIGEGLRVMSLGELLSTFGTTDGLTRERIRSLAHALEEMRIGVEPDVLAGARTPKIEDRIILFRAEAEDGTLRATPTYQVASVTLDLGCCVALADGTVHPSELRLLLKQIDSWIHLSNAQRKRLRARLRMSIDEPPSVAPLKKKLELVPAETKRAIARLLSALVQADGTVLPVEVKLLEKIYKLLGIDAQTAYADLHVAAMGTAPGAETAPRPASTTDGFALSAERIAALQRETDAVSTLLAGVFVDESATPIEDTEERDEANTQSQVGAIGLDAELTRFMRLLVSRSSWARQDLTDAAADMELMLDGALERINEAAIDQFGEPLIEGDDPVEVVKEIKEKIAA